MSHKDGTIKIMICLKIITNKLKLHNLHKAVHISLKLKHQLKLRSQFD